jgi:large subunit ribosomal protein L25
MVTGLTIAAEARETRGKNEARRLRVKGMMPAVMYGMGSEPAALAVNPKDLTRILHSRTGHNTIFNVSIAGAEPIPVIVIDWQNEPLKDHLLHVDLKRVDLSQRIVVKVPVVTEGDPRGVKLQGGLHEIVTREIEVECLPNEIPEQFVVNVTGLNVGDSIRASDVPLVGSMTLLSPADAVISHVISIRTDEAGTDAAAGGAEPEVIKKGKKEEGAAPDAGKKK